MSVVNPSKRKRYKVNLPEQLMECEFNYRRLLKLLQGTHSLPVASIRKYTVGNGPNTESAIEITIIEQTKYTSLVHIVQRCDLQKVGACINNSSHSYGGRSNVVKCAKNKKSSRLVYQADVRLYHDASVAEVVKCQRYHQFAARYTYPNVDMHQIDEKVQMNRFLGELLAHCLSYGRVSETIMTQTVVK